MLFLLRTRAYTHAFKKEDPLPYTPIPNTHPTSPHHQKKHEYYTRARNAAMCNTPCVTPRVTCQQKDTHVHTCQSFTKDRRTGRKWERGSERREGRRSSGTFMLSDTKKIPPKQRTTSSWFSGICSPPFPFPLLSPCPTHTHKWPRREHRRSEKSSMKLKRDWCV